MKVSVLKKLEWHEQAIELLDKISKITTINNAYLFVEKATSYLHLNRLDESLAILTIGLKEYPNDPHIHLNLGSTYYRMGKWAKSKKHYSLGAKLDSSFENEISYILNKIEERTHTIQPFDKTKVPVFSMKLQLNTRLAK